MVHLCLDGSWCFGAKWLNMQINLINNLNWTLDRTIFSQKSDIWHDTRWLNEQITMLKYLICIFICIFVILVNMSILSYLHDTRGCIFYLVSKILFESIFPNPAANAVRLDCIDCALSQPTTLLADRFSPWPWVAHARHMNYEQVRKLKGRIGWVSLPVYVAQLPPLPPWQPLDCTDGTWTVVKFTLCFFSVCKIDNSFCYEALLSKSSTSWPELWSTFIELSHYVLCAYW